MNNLTFKIKTLLLCGAIWGLASCADDISIKDNTEPGHITETTGLESRTTASFCQDYEDFSQKFCSYVVAESDINTVFSLYAPSGGNNSFHHGEELRAIELRSPTDSLLLSVNFDRSTSEVSTITKDGELFYDVQIKSNSESVGLKKLIEDLSTIKTLAEADAVIASSLPSGTATEVIGENEKFSSHQVSNNYLNDGGGGPGYDGFPCLLNTSFVSGQIASYLLRNSGATFSNAEYTALRDEIRTSMEDEGCSESYGGRTTCSECSTNIACPITAGLNSLSTTLNAQELTSLADYIASDLFNLSPGLVSTYISSQADPLDAALTMMFGVFSVTDVSECSYIESIYNTLINSTVLGYGDAFF